MIQNGFNGFADGGIIHHFGKIVLEKDVNILSSKQFFLSAVCLADAALEKITFDSPFEKPFRHGNHYPAACLLHGII